MNKVKIVVSRGQEKLEIEMDENNGIVGLRDVFKTIMTWLTYTHELVKELLGEDE